MFGQFLARGVPGERGARVHRAVASRTGTALVTTRRHLVRGTHALAMPRNRVPVQTHAAKVSTRTHGKTNTHCSSCVEHVGFPMLSQVAVWTFSLLLIPSKHFPMQHFTTLVLLAIPTGHSYVTPTIWRIVK